MNEALLCARGLALTRGARRLFDGLGFDLPAGRALMLLGPNGAGKSSLLRALVGLTPLAAGELRSGGEPITPRALALAAMYQGHAPATKGELTARENLQLAAALDGTIDGRTARAAADAAIAAALERVGLRRQRDIEARRLSQGQRQRLQIARFVLALGHAHRPLWLMDEPLSALDTEGSALLQATLAAHLARRGAALVATHAPLERLPADAVGELRIAASGAPH